jgi:hypothetical protein
MHRTLQLLALLIPIGVIACITYDIHDFAYQTKEAVLLQDRAPQQVRSDLGTK